MDAGTMSIPEEITSPLYKKEYSKRYVLHLMLKERLVLYIIADPLEKKLLHFSKSEMILPMDSPGGMGQLKSFFSKHEELQQIYEKVNVHLLSPYFILLPTRLSKLDDPEKLFKLHFQELPELAFQKGWVGKGATLIFGIPVNTFEYINSLFGEVNITHSAIDLLNHLLEINVDCEKVKVYAYINDRKLEIAVVDKGNLTLYNQFTFSSPEDFIYYIMLVYDQLRLNVEDTPLIFLGEIDKNSKLFNLAYKYIDDIRFGKRKLSLQPPPSFDDIPHHFYFNLLSC